MFDSKTLVDGTVILGGIITIAGLIYWAIKAKLKDDFCSKEHCNEKHKTLNGDMTEFKENTTTTLKEIKDGMLRMENRLYEFLSISAGKRRK